MYYTKNGKSFENLDYVDAENLKVGEEVYIGLWKDEAHKELEMIPAVVTRAAYYNADCDEPGWEIETNNGAADFYSLYRIKN